MERRPDISRVTIRDDGHGVTAPFGHGLNGMRERLASIGGSVTCENDGGTVLTITLPGEGPAAGTSIDAAERTA
jgi:signal transduction histidine kinase